jgi:hypothetical protein
MGSPFPLPDQIPIPEVPKTALSSRRFSTGEEGRELRPFAGTDFPVPDTQEEEFQARFEVWRDARANGVGSILEFIVYEFLVFVKKQIDGVDFEFQSPFAGGRTEFGGFVVDFILPYRGLAFQPEGSRWHLQQPQDRARLLIEQQILAGRGIRAIYLWERDLLTSPDRTLEAAWNGQQLQSGLVGFL